MIRETGIRLGSVKRLQGFKELKEATQKKYPHLVTTSLVLVFDISHTIFQVLFVDFFILFSPHFPK